jgi:signal transduction histidine kinase
MSISLHPDTPQGRTLAASPVASAAPEAPAAGPKIRSRLFTKYVALFVAVVGVALLSNGIFEVFFYYREHKAALIRIQHEQAEAAAAKIGQFIKEIESQLGWTTQLPWSAGSIEQRRFDALRLLRQVPAITELAQVDSTGKERLRVSRLAMDVVDSGLDLSKDPKFTEAVAHKVYYGPVYFRRESEPYMTLSLAGTRKDAGVSIAEVNLKLIWDVVSQIKVGERGHAYVVGAQGRLIAHPDISLVLRNTDMSKLVQVQAANAGNANTTDPEGLQGARNIQGQEVLTASAPIAPLGWTMFVELPVEEAYASLYLALQRLAIVLLGALVFAVFAGIFLARRMVGPIQALRVGAERIGSGDFAQRISIKTGDELEGLADQFNDMGTRLQESYTDLEKKVESRTAELSETLQQQTATAEILSSISASMTDTKPVFDAIVRNLRRLFGTRFAVLQTLRDDGMVEMPAVDGDPGFEKLIDRYPRRLSDDTVGGLAMLSKHPIQYSPVLGNPATPATTQQFARDFGFNSVIFTPMLLGDKVIGAIGVARHDAGSFDEKQIALIGSFASQAVIAIENTRLLKELRERTDDLSASLEDLRTAQDRLVQTEKLASLGQLTAGIAHEIKNPLNFVNNFSALSAELVDELNDALKPAGLDDKIREEVDELTLMLKGNLEKVVQHGKRADSIVKNMLLHSREGSGEHRPADINAIVEESLNLAYHGARAEKSGFNITLQRHFDPGAGMIDLYPQEITRVFLNLISNGFYAAAKRKEAGDETFEPVLSATTKNLGNRVEIRIRDNGTGIPLEVKEKMFNPFFTTKPAGEGTGLGLSMSHDIVVKQHGGKIDVDTEPGAFTEFIITLPRTAAAQAQAGGTN